MLPGLLIGLFIGLFFGLLPDLFFGLLVTAVPRMLYRLPFSQRRSGCCTGRIRRPFPGNAAVHAVRPARARQNLPVLPGIVLPGCLYIRPAGSGPSSCHRDGTLIKGSRFPAVLHKAARSGMSSGLTAWNGHSLHLPCRFAAIC